MDPDDMLEAARAGLLDVVPRLTGLIASLPRADAQVLPEWTVRDVAAHLVNETNQAAHEATGAPSPHVWTDKDAFNASSQARLADIPETDPPKLAELMTEAADRLLHAIEGRPGDAPAACYGREMGLARVVSIHLSDWAVHGYDVAAAVGAPWTIDPIHAHLGFAGYAPFFPVALNPDTSTGHTASHRIELRGGDTLVARFAGGVLALEPPDSGPVDCVVSADPVAFLLTGLGRMTQWQAIALGLLSASGDRPELAYGFLDLFRFP